MHNRYSDFEELRPTGEASHIPDTRLDGDCEDDPRRQRVATNTGGYPDAPTTADGECRSCGAAIPDGQTKCRFCLTNHLGGDTTSTDESASTTFLGIVHLVVESRTSYGAVAKGATATNLLAKGGSDPSVDDGRLIYDLNEAPAAQLTDKWSSLPSAARISSEIGEQLFAAARERTTWRDTTRSCRDDEHATFLYDETGSGIRDQERLATLLEDADDDVWLVPAIALQQSVTDTSTGSPRHEHPNREHLECRECDRETTHRFSEFETVPDDEWVGQPMWECQVCGTPRYGPEPDADQERVRVLFATVFSRRITETHL